MEIEEENSVGGFLRNRENPLETDVIIIDEMSMVDLNLMHALLSAVFREQDLFLWEMWISFRPWDREVC